MEAKQKQSRFQWLRQREQAGTLTQSQWTELTRLIEEIESAQAVFLQPSVQREEAERQRPEAQTAQLETLASRQENSLHTLERSKYNRPRAPPGAPRVAP